MAATLCATPVPATAPAVTVTAPPAAEASSPLLHWTEGDQPCAARWRSERGLAPPRRVVIADDSMAADTAYRLACEGTALLWRGDFQNARHLLQALVRRFEQVPVRKRRSAPPAPPAAAHAPVSAEQFHQHRMARAQRARILGAVLLPFDADYGIPLRRAPDARLACQEAWGDPDGQPSVASLRELTGLISAHEWRRNGVEIPALARGARGAPAGTARIHPHYGVFSPVRGEYVELVARAPWPGDSEGHLAPAPALAFDIGTGTGVLAALLARRGAERVIATDLDLRALACARENLARLGVQDQIAVLQSDLYPPASVGRAAVIVCNPPWLPGRAASPLEHAVYDEGSRMLLGFLNGLPAHLAPGGEGWLILSDLAEHLGLRTRADLLAHIERAGLVVLGRQDIRPRHPKAGDAHDALHAARRAEVTSLWRLGVAPGTAA